MTFLAIFGVERDLLPLRNENVRKLKQQSGFIDLFLARRTSGEQKSRAGTWPKAAIQAGKFPMPERGTERPRFTLLCEFPGLRACWTATRARRLPHIG